MPDKVALVTGSSSGIGLLTAIELANNGFKVIASMRDLGRRDRLDQAASAAGVSDKLDVQRLDVSEFAAMPAFAEKLVGDYGRLDVLVNNAGFAVAGFAEDVKLDELRQQFETNFFGHVALTKAVLPIMRQQGSGHIIMVSSISGLHGAFSVSSYAASKFALEGWSESLRLEVNALGIKVVLVEPGAYKTDIWDRNASSRKRWMAALPTVSVARSLRNGSRGFPSATPSKWLDSLRESPKTRILVCVTWSVRMLTYSFG